MSGELTDEQHRVVELPFATKAFVIAGPGAGKTHTLVHRLGYLLDARESDSAVDILVLSFTRAVVGELRRRIGEHPHGGLVRPVTIDFYASRILSEHLDENALGHSYDQRILRAAQVLRQLTTRGEQHRHVVVDEAQDLAEPRRAFVAAVLDRADGFTVFGDPAQGIYGFRSKRAAGRGGAMETLQAEFPAAATYSLTGNQRVRSHRASIADWAHKPLTVTPAPVLHAQLRQVLRDASRLTLDELLLVLRAAPGRTALLCRDGAEVLDLSQRLHEESVAHQVQPSASHGAPPRWPADVLALVEDPVVTRSSFFALTRDRGDDWQRPAWRALRRLATFGDGVGMARLRERLFSLTAEEVPDQDLSGLPVISTIHRAKGLEFDQVVVLEPRELTSDEDGEEESRVLFVALTRARSETLMLTRPSSAARMQKRAGRWVAIPWRSRAASGVEIRPGDVDRAVPPGYPDRNVVDIQRRLKEHVKPGDRITIVRAGAERLIIHDGTPIGVLSKSFDATLHQIGAADAGDICDVWVDVVSSGSGDPQLTANLDLGNGGLWLVPELIGLGRITWRNA